MGTQARQNQAWETRLTATLGSVPCKRKGKEDSPWFGGARMQLHSDGGQVCEVLGSNTSGMKTETIEERKRLTFLIGLWR